MNNRASVGLVTQLLELKAKFPVEMLSAWIIVHIQSLFMLKISLQLCSSCLPLFSLGK